MDGKLNTFFFTQHPHLQLGHDRQIYRIVLLLVCIILLQLCYLQAFIPPYKDDLLKHPTIASAANAELLVLSDKPYSFFSTFNDILSWNNEMCLNCNTCFHVVFYFPYEQNFDGLIPDEIEDIVMFRNKRSQAKVSTVYFSIGSI